MKLRYDKELNCDNESRYVVENVGVIEKFTRLEYWGRDGHLSFQTPNGEYTFGGNGFMPKYAGCMLLDVSHGKTCNVLDNYLGDELELPDCYCGGLFCNDPRLLHGFLLGTFYANLYNDPTEGLTEIQNKIDLRRPQKSREWLAKNRIPYPPKFSEKNDKKKYDLLVADSSKRKIVKTKGDLDTYMCGAVLLFLD